MSRRIYNNGVLVEEWDDVRKLYTTFNAAGAILTQRSYTAPEIAGIVGGGSAQVVGHDFVAFSDAGVEMLRIGDMQYGDRGIKISREDGTAALELRKSFSNSTEQSLVLRDADGSVLIAEESLGGGIGQPYFPIPLLPILAASGAVVTGPWGPEVTSAAATGTWVTTHQAWFARTNQFGMFRTKVAASDATTAGEVRVINAATSTALGMFLAGAWTGVRAAGPTTYTEVVSSGGLQLPGTVHAAISVAVQVRRTAGTGTLTVAVPEARGWAA